MGVSKKKKNKRARVESLPPLVVEIYNSDQDDPNELDPARWIVPEEERRSTTREFCQQALEHYNKENGTNYELVQALGCSNMFKPDGITIHCNFEAKPTNENDSSSTKFFFGEILCAPVNDSVTYCDILKGKKIYNCKDCGPTEIKHPSSHFLLPSFNDVMTRSRAMY